MDVPGNELTINRLLKQNTKNRTVTVAITAAATVVVVVVVVAAAAAVAYATRALSKTANLATTIGNVAEEISAVYY